MTNIWDNIGNIITNPHFYVLFILLVMIIVIGFFVEFHTRKRLGDVDISRKKFDWRKLIYMSVYVYYGYHFPNDFIEFLILAVIWKFIDVGICSRFFLRLSKCKNGQGDLFCEGLKLLGNCAEGKWIDVVFNMMAFAFGILLFRMRHR